MSRRVYFFEVFALANVGILYLIARHTLPIVGIPWRWIIVMAWGILPQVFAGIAVRSAIALFRRDFTYFRIIRSREWIVDTLRLVLSTGVMIFGYAWLKLVVPVLHPRLFDQELWDLDQMLFFGIAPSQFFADVFHHGVLRAVDWSYAAIFYASAFVAFAYFLSEPSRRVRIAFANGNAAMWIAGAWLYLLVPSLGPAYRFPDIWFAHEEALKLTQTLQAVLMRNYQNILRVMSGQPATEPIRIYFGIAAFPSLHVAFQTYVFLWMRRLWTSGEVLFVIFLLAIFLGSMVTGWHYLIDAIAGLLLALACYAVTWRASRMSRWLAIKAAR